MPHWSMVDDVLQDELSRASSDDGMKNNIVATIQRDQNAIIRNDDAHTLIIQGVAGSGKTSIALHRIAYLLYRFKDTLSSDDILIISPNRVFADYIGNVLPELGEEQVAEIGMETLATELLDHQYRFQSFFEQTTSLLESGDETLRARITAKASPGFLHTIDRYVDHLEKKSFQAVQWNTGRKIVPDWFFAEAWQKHPGVDLIERIARVVKATESQIGFHYNYDLRTELTKSFRSTWEIMQLALAIAPNPELEAMERHGENPRLLRCAGTRGMVIRLREEIDAFDESAHHSLAIIVKTQKQANRLHKSLVDATLGVRLLAAESTGFSSGVIICSAHMAKGLELDRVIIADVSASNFHTEMDRHLLYVACTRAMHRLVLFFTGDPSPFIQPQLPGGTEPC
ncbi:3'-5' exonuclease [Haliea sp. E1-2-M8]|uniref:3'-5' exonuclease n=1 Tax=Haliea sp. E1-2-M8 TaxID=3064706 RepID=UPI002715DC83|nr:3'-5' exonuclease [Haliea sp. E1-2-M8]MDO8862094.1 3'-5' exonuclease [Haliea sp. E1-2-M8]